jgi:phosphoethanolamine N-methyltransferase
MSAYSQKRTFSFDCLVYFLIGRDGSSARRTKEGNTMTDTSGEYTEEHLVGHAIVWGEGWMSPGGDKEVASVVEGLDLSGRTILDIGSGLGGPAIALVANHDAGKIVSIDIQAEQVERSRQLATKRGVSDRITFQLVEPGPFPFEDANFDVVFSLGVLVQIPNKPSLFADISRVLRPGGTLTANDWLRGDDGPLSAEMLTFMEGAGLTYNWATLDETRGALEQAGFTDVAIRDRRLWLLGHLQADIERLEAGSVRDRLIQEFDEEAAEGWLGAWRLMEVMADRGEICTVQLRATKPT